MLFRFRAVSIFKNVEVNIVERILIISDFITSGGLALISPFFAVFITDQIPGGTIEVVGFATALYAICKSLAALPIARFLDATRGQWDDYLALFVGSWVMAICPFLYLLVHTPWQLYIVQMVYGISTAFSWVAWDSIFARNLDTKSVALEYSLDQLLVDLATAITAGAGGLIVSMFGFPSLFILAGAIACAGNILLLVIAGKFKLAQAQA